jgi:hypothetical protein
MKIYIFLQKGEHPVLNATVSYAIERGYNVVICGGTAIITVPDFPKYLSCLWFALCDVSRVAAGETIHGRFFCRVLLDNGHVYNVWQQVADDNKGLRYGGEYIGSIK